MIKLCKVYACSNGTLGLHLTRAPWDPYPWISDIQTDSSAAQAGMRTGDTVLEINECDVLGQKIIEIAERVRQHWQSGAKFISMVIWRNSSEEDEENTIAACNDKGKAHINQQSLQKFATCLQHISQLLECPVCLEIIRPPSWQCCNGHVLCNNCRSRSVKCPVCRVPLGPRGRCLLADKLFHLLAESFPSENARRNCNMLKAEQKNNSEFHSNCTKAATVSDLTLEAKVNSKNHNEKEILENLRTDGIVLRSGGKTLSQLQTRICNCDGNNSNRCLQRTSRIVKSQLKSMLDNTEGREKMELHNGCDSGCCEKYDKLAVVNKLTGGVNEHDQQQ